MVSQHYEAVAVMHLHISQIEILSIMLAESARFFFNFVHLAQPAAFLLAASSEAFW